MNFSRGYFYKTFIDLCIKFNYEPVPKYPQCVTDLLFWDRVINCLAVSAKEELKDVFIVCLPVTPVKDSHCWGAFSYYLRKLDANNNSQEFLQLMADIDIVRKEA